eukprot:8533724-Prorocentrum_lima.AAC.1
MPELVRLLYGSGEYANFNLLIPNHLSLESMSRSADLFVDVGEFRKLSMILKEQSALLKEGKDF